MKNKWLFVFTCLLPFNVWAATVYVDVSDTLLDVGDIFTVDLVADFEGDLVLGWGLDLTYDSSIVTLVSSPTIGSDWLPATTLDGDGLGGLAFPATTGTDVLLATLTFEALSEGTTDLLASITLGDFTEGISLLDGFADIEFVNSSVTVSPVPLPASLPMMLMGLGLLSLGLRRRKKLTTDPEHCCG